MERRMGFWFKPIFVGLLLAVLALAGCEGDDGDRGPAGPAGPAGEGIALEDQIAAGDLTADDVTPMNLILDLTQTVSYNSANGALTVHFFLTDEDGDGVDVTQDAYELRVYVAELIPAEPIVAGAVDPGPAWDRLIFESGTPAADDPLPGTLTLVDAATGEYNYVLDAALPTSDNVQRVTMRARWRSSARDVNGERVVFANAVNAHYDFLQSDPGTPLASSGADMVSTAACESCHGDRIGDVGHGGGYTQVTTCNNCHNLNYLSSQGDSLEADFAYLIHRIHDAGTFEEITGHGSDVPIDFSELTYPQNIYTCSKCHDGPDADVTYMYPTRRNCGSCHDEVDFETGANHPGGIAVDDAGCNICHPAASITAAHMPIPDSLFDARNVSEFDVTIDMEAPANGEFYEAGETPLVTVTLVDTATGLPVASAVYTTAQDGVGAAGNLTAGLSEANLFVFGPRAEAVPVFTTGSTTDPVTPGTQQGHPLFVGGADLQVMTDVDGFKYELLAIPADATPGTYMVRFEAADYGAVDDVDYQTHSSALITFQVGTATEEPKVSGEACVDCHGATIMHLEGAHPHHAPFDTDHCLGCHDLSLNYAEYIGNRAHAIHRASATGDLHGSSRVWTDVTFPRPANNCTTCHTNLEADTPVWRTPYMAACGGCHGINPDAVPADFPGADPAQIEAEAGAAQHMLNNGGVPDVSAGGFVNFQCVVCHGEGRIADLVETHQLIRFRAQPADPNE